MEENKYLKNQVKSKIAMSNFISEEKIAMKNKKIFLKKKSALVASLLVVIISGSVLAFEARNYIINKQESRNGFKKAIQNDYIEELNVSSSDENSTINIENVDKINNVNTIFNIKDFLMDDSNINIGANIVFDNNINKYKNFENTEKNNINYEEFGNVVLSDIYVLDEKDNLLYSSSKNEDSFDLFCNENNLNYKFKEYNDKYYNSLINININDITSNPNTIELAINISSLSLLGNANLECNFPNSDKIRIYINQIMLIPNNTAEKTISIDGKWKLEFDVSSIMKNRDKQYYKVVSCENSDFDVYDAFAIETGFELGITISNVDEPIYPNELAEIDQKEMDNNNGQMNYPMTREGIVQFYGSEQYANLYEEYIEKRNIINLTGEPKYSWSNYKSDGCYILNENNEKFTYQFGKRRQNQNFKYDMSNDENGFAKNTFLNQYDFYETFEMTKYDATDKIIAIIDYKNKPVKIELEKE